jgi:hypothetical protein
VLGALACALVAACTASAEDVRPPSDQLFFPTGLAVFPKTNALFVANSNSELRYDSGSLMVVDLGVVESVISAWLTSQDQGPCKPDVDHRETLVCDEAMFFKSGAGVRIGNFATDVGVQDFSTSGPAGVVKLRVFVPTRGDPSVAWADYNGDKLSCFPQSNTDQFPLCDEGHRLASIFNDPNGVAIPDEPFGVYAATQPPLPPSADDPAPLRSGFALVTHLTSGTVTLIDAPEDGTVEITDARTGLFQIDPGTQLFGASSVVGRAPGTDDNLVYVASRSDPRIWTFTVGRPVNRAPPFLLQGAFLLQDAIGNGIVGTESDTRGMQFSPNGERMYVVNRRPPALQVFDTSIGPTGTPRNLPTGATDICRQASTVAVVGRGPYSIAAAADQKQLFVSNYLEDTIAVIDIDPASPTRNRVVLRIGQPRAL